MNTEKMKRRYTSQEKLKLVSEYQNSGLPQKAWCSEHHISVNTLYKWMCAGAGCFAIHLLARNRLL